LWGFGATPLSSYLSSYIMRVLVRQHNHGVRRPDITHMTQKIIWLASYPKAGNTWFRILLANYFSRSDEPVDINNLTSTPIASGRHLFDEATGVESSNLTYDEIDAYRPDVYRYIMHTTDVDPMYMKVHDAYYSPSGNALFPADVTRGVIYFIRNPLDVVVSYANHSGTSVANMLNAVNNPDHGLVINDETIHVQIRQWLSSWRGHVESWVDQSGLPLHVIRYENMLADTLTTFRQALTFIGIDVDEARLQKAVEFSRFNVVKKQEQEIGFKEKVQGVESFFYKGKAGTWREEMTAEQVAEVINFNRDLMRRLGYLDDDDNILY
jgi:hypothetical protein